VRRFKRVCDLLCHLERFWNGDRTFCDAIRERRPLDQLHDDELLAVGLLEPVDDRDVLVVQAGEEFGFALEANDAFRVGADRLRKDLDGDLAIKAGVG
jgi:hypothetical protein